MTANINKVAFIGLGKMGSAIAKKLLEAGFDLTVYNRTEAKMKPLLAMGATGAASAKEAVVAADVVLTSLFDDQSVLEVVSEKGPQEKINVTNLLKAFNDKLEGFTPFHAAVFFGHKETVKVFLDKGIDMTITASGISALDFAQAMGHQEIIAMLKAKTVEIDADQKKFEYDPKLFTQPSAQNVSAESESLKLEPLDRPPQEIKQEAKKRT